LKMVDGVLLLVDAAEGPMPQTRFVLQKALEFGHKIIIVVNKIDRPDARLNEIGDEVLELLLNLDATDEQLDSPIIYCSGRAGTASMSPNTEGADLTPLFEQIMVHVPAPHVDMEGTMQMLVSSIDYNDYVGRIGIGRIERGTVKVGQQVTVCDYHGHTTPYTAKLNTLYAIDGLGRTPVESADAGDIVCFSGIENITIGETICDPQNVQALPFVKISEPTVEMYFSVNDSPFAGREGKYVTSRHLRDRLFRELLKDVSLRVNETDTTESFRVCGRGEMHLSILIENLRREGYEFQVGAPRALLKEVDGVKCEPIERMIADVPQDAVGSVMEKMGSRKGELVSMNPKGDRMRVEFLVPARGLFGYRNEFLTDTRGEGVLSSVFHSYQPYRGEIQKRSTGSMIAFETGESITYGLFNAQERGTLFIGAGVQVYEGMVVGCTPKSEDMAVNVCKKKQLTNTRASGSDDALRLIPPHVMSIEESLEFIKDDELLEITPKSVRIRKKILNNQQRMKKLHG
ncbi:MAG: translational GTPase TypA, partial [Eubacteriales bacterium]|nr:translational GTPase TypA [Eubacteriales bacterium]